MIKCRLDCDTEWAPTQQNNFTFIPGGSIHDVAVYYIILPSIHLTRLLNLKGVLFIQTTSITLFSNEMLIVRHRRSSVMAQKTLSWSSNSWCQCARESELLHLPTLHEGIVINYIINNQSTDNNEISNRYLETKMRLSCISVCIRWLSDAMCVA